MLRVVREGYHGPKGQHFTARCILSSDIDTLYSLISILDARYSAAEWCGVIEQEGADVWATRFIISTSAREAFRAAYRSAKLEVIDKMNMDRLKVLAVGRGWYVWESDYVHFVCGTVHFMLDRLHDRGPMYLRRVGKMYGIIE